MLIWYRRTDRQDRGMLIWHRRTDRQGRGILIWHTRKIDRIEGCWYGTGGQVDRRH